MFNGQKHGFFGSLRTALALAAATVAAPVWAQQWVMATPYPDTNFHTQNIKQFAEDVKAATGGKLVITLHTNASLVPMPQIKRAVQSGQAQMGEILLSAYGNEDPFFEVDGVPMLSPGFDNAKKLWAASKPYVEKRFRAQGVVPLFSVPWPPQGLYTKKPITSLTDLKGMKFRAYNAVTARMAELVGAVPITVQQAEVPQAFATGVVDSMVTSGATGVDTKAWDFSKYYYDMRVINNKNVVLVSQKALEALEPAVRTAVLDAAAKAETRGWAASERTMDETTKRLAAEGLKVETPTPALRAELQKLGETMAAEWIKRAGPEGEAMLKAYRP
jgi:TRAP-type C4-dicarboxylate transport system substrate-binding protein